MTPSILSFSVIAHPTNMKKLCKRCQKIIEAKGNTRYRSDCALIITDRKILSHHDKYNVEYISKLEYQLELYEKMFKAQDDMITEKDEKLNELRNVILRLNEYITNLQNQLSN